MPVFVRMSASLKTAFAGLLALASLPVAAQEVVRQDEALDSDRPEAWAMHYRTASTLMTAFGPSPALAPGDWQAAVELGEIPHLPARKTAVGFNGQKNEDLNKSPVFGRVRGWIGLPGGFVAELAWTPPVEIEGAKARDLWAAAIARRVVDANGVVVSLRAFGQHGAVVGDVTCPAELAGVQDFNLNPYGCQAPSSDTLQLNYYGLETTAALMHGPWTWHLSGGVVRMENEVQVDALTYGFRDYSRLTASDDVGYLAFGVGRSLAKGWGATAEVLYVPLTVLRTPDGSADSDPMLSFRLQVRYAFDAQ
jgi:hypothetical protein